MDELEILVSNFLQFMLFMCCVFYVRILVFFHSLNFMFCLHLNDVVFSALFLVMHVSVDTLCLRSEARRYGLLGFCE